jgi:hypothetical protein
MLSLSISDELPLLSDSMVVDVASLDAISEPEVIDCEIIDAQTAE